MNPQDQALRELLLRLRIATVRRLCERLEDPEETATPSYLEAARKLLESQLREEPVAPPRGRPITEGLPIFHEDG